MSDFLINGLVKQETISIDDLWEDGNIRPECPYCASKKVKSDNHTTTLVYGNPDPNHHWHTCKCECEKEFGFQHKYSGKTYSWYTEIKNWEWPNRKYGVDKCIKGICACCGPCLYDCKCGGIVYGEHLDKSGNRTESLGYVFASPAKSQVLTFKCNKCDFFVQEPWEKENWSPPPTQEDLKGRIKLYAYSELGFAILDNRVIQNPDKIFWAKDALEIVKNW